MPNTQVTKSDAFVIIEFDMSLRFCSCASNICSDSASHWAEEFIQCGGLFRSHLLDPISFLYSGCMNQVVWVIICLLGCWVLVHHSEENTQHHAHSVVYGMLSPINRVADCISLIMASSLFSFMRGPWIPESPTDCRASSWAGRQVFWLLFEPPELVWATTTRSSSWLILIFVAHTISMSHY